MIIKERPVDGAAHEVTFVVPDLGLAEPVSIVGDFNGWQPGVHLLHRQAQGHLHIALTLGTGRYQYRFVDAEGRWFNDDQADDYVTTEAGPTNGVVIV